jgi:hypothetical protein
MDIRNIPALSCPAKAGHPVITAAIAFTGSSAGACHRGGHFGPRPLADDDKPAETTTIRGERVTGYWCRENGSAYLRENREENEWPR